MKEFVINNWRDLLSAACMLVSLILFIVRKKPFKVVDSLREVIVRLLPALINNAETKSELKGEQKMSCVVDELVLILQDLGYGSEVINQYLPFAREQVEVILSTPQKKVR